MAYKEFLPNGLYYCFDQSRYLSKHICVGKDIIHNPFSYYELVTSICGLKLCVNDSTPIITDPIHEVIICTACREYWKTYDLVIS
jgi:hypothetical protein